MEKMGVFRTRVVRVRQDIDGYRVWRWFLVKCHPMDSLHIGVEVSKITEPRLCRFPVKRFRLTAYIDGLLGRAMT